MDETGAPVENSRCQQLLQHLSAYLDGEAGDAVCAAVEAHLKRCERCRIVVDTTRQTIYLYRQVPRPPLSTGTRERLYRALHLDDLL